MSVHGEIGLELVDLKAESLLCGGAQVCHSTPSKLYLTRNLGAWCGLRVCSGVSVGLRTMAAHCGPRVVPVQLVDLATDVQCSGCHAAKPTRHQGIYSDPVLPPC